MRYLTLRTTVILACCLLVLGGEASWDGGFRGTECAAMSAISEIRVLGKISVSRKQVFLLDLCDSSTIPEDWRKIMAKQDIGEAPAVSSEKFVEPATMKVYLEWFIESQGADPAQVRITMPDKIVVARQAVQISQEQIESIFQKYIRDNSPWNPQDVVIQKVSFTGLPILPEGPMTYEVVPSQRGRFVGNVNVAINFFVNAEKVRSLGVSGKVDVFQNVIHASRALKQNDLITAADLEYQRVNVTESTERYATQPDQVVNKRLLRNVGIHQAFELKNLDKPLLLKRGDAVTIIYNTPGLQLTAKGQVREEGGMGDTVRVSNVSSDRTIHCRVIDSQTVQAVR